MVPSTKIVFNPVGAIFKPFEVTNHVMTFVTLSTSRLKSQFFCTNIRLKPKSSLTRKKGTKSENVSCVLMIWEKYISIDIILYPWKYFYIVVFK